MTSTTIHDTDQTNYSSSSSSYDDDSDNNDDSSTSSSSSSSSSSSTTTASKHNNVGLKPSTALTVHNNNNKIKTSDSYSNQDTTEEIVQQQRQQPVSPTIDDERQILLLMLLAQVCALHDVTPKTFTVHVLELYERGILDQSSIHFLYDLGLVVVPGPETTTIAAAQGIGVPQNVTLSEATTPTVHQEQQSQQDVSFKNDHQTQNSHQYHQHQQAQPSTKISVQAVENIDVDELAMVVASNSNANNPQLKKFNYQKQRSMEASAIRSSLEYHDQLQQQKQLRQQQQKMVRNGQQQQHATTEHRTITLAPAATMASSWSVEEHPLSLSRYQREFKEIQRLASGSFGDVYHVMCYLDSCEYAIKRVLFNATGYSNHTIQQVIREIHCLAKCDHPNVVRYYTSWLEPSWMTGSTTTPAVTTSSTDLHQNLNVDDTTGTESYLKLITDIQSVIATGTNNGTNTMEYITDNFLQSYLNDECTGSHCQDDCNYDDPRKRMYRSNRRQSFSSYGSNSILDENDSLRSNYFNNRNEWDRIYTAKDDISINGYQSRNQQFHTKEIKKPLRVNTRTKEHPEQQLQQQMSPVSYRYQISMYIQMQLCNSITLADFIRTRNVQQQQEQQVPQNICTGQQFDTAMIIFEQIVQGLRHVHEHNIVHRDLKPSNVFTCCSNTQSLNDDGVLNFKIGDFGLSKLIPTASTSDDPNRTTGRSHPTQQLLLFESPTATSNAIVSPKDAKSPHDKNYSTMWEHHHTAGVGTASYAAPEQVVTQTYGTAVDIYSLGLILLELVCYFTTEHERLQTFYNCRQQRIVPKEVQDHYPMIAHVILSCTDPNAARRPTAKELCTNDLRCVGVDSRSTGGIVNHTLSYLQSDRNNLDETKDTTTATATTIICDKTNCKISGHTGGSNDKDDDNNDTTTTCSAVTVLEQELFKRERRIQTLQQQLEECQLELKRKDELIEQLRKC